MRGDSSQPVAGHVTVPINTGHAVAQAQPHSRKLGGSSLNSRFQSGPVQGLLLFRREEMQRHSLVDDDSKRGKKKEKKRQMRWWIQVISVVGTQIWCPFVPRLPRREKKNKCSGLSERAKHSNGFSSLTFEVWTDADLFVFWFFSSA